MTLFPVEGADERAGPADSFHTKSGKTGPGKGRAKGKSVDVKSSLDSIFTVQEGTREARASFWVEVDRLQDNPFQPRTRIDPEELKELVSSFDASGQLHAALVRKHP